MRAALEEDFTDLARDLDELSVLGDEQVALTLLPQCASTRPRYVQRALAPTPGELEVYRRFNQRLRNVIAELLGEEPLTSTTVVRPWNH